MSFHANTDTLRLGNRSLLDTVAGLETVMQRAQTVVDGVSSHVGQDDLRRGLEELADTAQGGHADVIWALQVLAGRMMVAAQEVEQTDADLATGVRVGD